MLLFIHVLFTAAMWYVFGIYVAAAVGLYLIFITLYMMRYNNFVYRVVAAQRDEIDRLRGNK